MINHYSGISQRIEKIKALMVLMRIPNCIALGLLFIATRKHFSLDLVDNRYYLQACLWVLLAAFSYSYNDLCDIEIDRINKPLRPLPSGAISLIGAKTILAVILFLIGCLIATDWQSTLVWASGTLIASWSYSRFLRRRTALVSNLLAGGLVALVPLSGVSFIGDAKSWVLSAGIFFLMFGRELQKDALDSEGDTRYRPPSILLRNPNGIFRLVYPLILIMSGVLLYSAVLSDHFWANLGALTIAALHGLALIAFLHNREGHQMQANITKVASYWLVIVLLI